MLCEIIDIICEYVDADPASVSADSNLRADLGATSFDLMNVAVAIEERYAVSIPDSALPSIRIVGDILRLLEG